MSEIIKDALRDHSQVSWSGNPLPAAYCPECGKGVMLRSDGKSLYTHNRAPRQQCPMSRQPINIIESEDKR